MQDMESARHDAHWPARRTAAARTRGDQSSTESRAESILRHRSASSAIPGSWVTTTTEEPCSANSWSPCTTMDMFRASRAPVGSSAKTIGGIQHEGARDGDALLLAPGELIRVGVQEGGHADSLERRQDRIALTPHAGHP